MPASFDLTAVARSLLNIEVNTILRDSMTGEPMPPIPHALLDIAGWYAKELCALGVNVALYFAPDASELEKLEPGWVKPPAPLHEEMTISPATFDRLRWAAKWAAERGGRPIAPEKRVLLDRIVNNCDAIKEMFKRFDAGFNGQFLNRSRTALLGMTIRPNSYGVQPNDVIQIQKTWDIGTEQIVVQTVVMVTGDITTRVQEGLAGARADLLFGIHRQSVDVSVGRWKVLLEAVSEIAGTAVGRLLGRTQ
jgi:hypothetical protein